MTISLHGVVTAYNDFPRSRDRHGPQGSMGGELWSLGTKERAKRLNGERQGRHTVWELWKEASLSGPDSFSNRTRRRHKYQSTAKRFDGQPAAAATIDADCWSGGKELFTRCKGVLKAIDTSSACVSKEKTLCLTEVAPPLPPKKSLRACLWRVQDWLVLVKSLKTLLHLRDSLMKFQRFSSETCNTK